MFSSGISSWAAAKRYAETNGTDGMVLLFADTGIEDEDNYRFLHEAAANIGAPLTVIADGRTPWDVFADVRMIGNARVDPCSKHLKRKLLDKWRNTNVPRDAAIILGIAWDEEHRIRKVRELCAPWNYIAPLCDKPWISKRDCIAWAKREGIEPPRMYAQGFAHANCGGFCVKAGQATFRLLLAHYPERYAEHEKAEAELMKKLKGKWGVMRDRRGGTAKPMTMRQFRERVEADENAYDKTDLGGCGCALNL
jgi:3'-phosphoadenosine 5'-phosphosulfate sulfotransferase (PAPS reductase)/FAD synthetase